MFTVLPALVRIPSRAGVGGVGRRGAGAFRADVGGFKVLCAFTGRPQLECGRWDARIQPKRR